MTSLKGRLLVATPELLSPIFTQSVILMLEHSGEGAAGLVLNRPTDSTVASISDEVFDEPSDWPKPIGLGGPVPGPLIVLHTSPELSDQEVLPGVYSSVDSDKVRILIQQQVEPSLPIANYSGWSSGQLENEIAEGSWISLPARFELIFWEGDGELWKAVTKEYNAQRLAQMLHLREVPADPRSN